MDSLIECTNWHFYNSVCIWIRINFNVEISWYIEPNFITWTSENLHAEEELAIEAATGEEAFAVLAETPGEEVLEEDPEAVVAEEEAEPKPKEKPRRNRFRFNRRRP